MGLLQLSPLEGTPMGRTKTETWATYRPTNHAKHIFWSFMTAGAWAITGYPICHYINKHRARAVTVKTTQYDGYGGSGRDYGQSGYEAQ
jgi:hypothetical protein